MYLSTLILTRKAQWFKSYSPETRSRIAAEIRKARKEMTPAVYRSTLILTRKAQWSKSYSPETRSRIAAEIRKARKEMTPAVYRSVRIAATANVINADGFRGKLP